ncbi:1-deoxy-D-xylulose-5-phosphate reductoisomerase [Epidermidibacterium keratini]|uniref:1-deoxy-D-xylulose 5-phosphate reductoisomerase n=1 Tax=Epidermidibacterium keratini TaxID=1891644 RepID=A0A7L4YRK7_9ACTN|nr:1-deoxy-D-xylulose-5-phosphate reductoisomerase [Epidermidibacterium keratini]
MRDNRAVSIRDVVILGATGSIGTQAIEIIRANPDRFRAVALSASGRHPAQLAEDALELGVHTVAVAQGTAIEDVLLHLKAAAQRRGTQRLPKVIGGPGSTADLAELDCDVVLNAVAGSVGLAATLRTLQRGTTLALANKESLVAGGRLVTELAAPGQIVPVDSEHSAMAQCLRAGRRDEVARFILTASGGPFRGRTAGELDNVTLEQALAHPTWAMGLSNTLNSATLVNKGLELIEAHLLFDVDPEDIVVTVHPQSIVHSMIEYADGSTIAQASPPDMRLPISLALGWPERVPDASPTFDWTQSQTWTFEPLDDATFPAVSLARHSAKVGGQAPAAYNAANEEAIAAFAEGRLRFGDIVRVIDGVLDQGHAHGDLTANAGTFDDVLAGEQVARDRAQQLIAGLQKD